MDKTIKFAAAILLIAILGGALGYIASIAGIGGSREKAIHIDIVLGGEKPGCASLNVLAGYNIKVYREGELIAERVKENDPVTIHWYRLLADFMFIMRRGTLNWQDTGGTLRTWIDTEYYGINPVAHICLGEGSATPSRSDYSLQIERASVAVASSGLTFSEDQANKVFSIKYDATFTISTAFTLREVGLKFTSDVNTGSGTTSAFYLFCRDQVSPPVSLSVGDVVAVSYTVTIPYTTTGGFTRWFYHAVINYLLGYRGVTGGYLQLKNTGGANAYIDTAADEYGVPDTIAGEYTFVVIGRGSSSQPFDAYTISLSAGERRIDDSQMIISVSEGSDALTITYTTSFFFASTTTVSELGVRYNTDGTSGSSSGEVSYYWLYWPLQNPVTVNAGDGLKVIITVTFPYS